MSFENKPLRNDPKDCVMPSKESRIAPRSMLANLLSSQHRSAVQTQRHRIQSARPFAGSAQIENAAKRVAAQLFPQPPQGINRQRDGIIYQSSYNISNKKPFTSSSSEPYRRVTFLSHADSISRKKARLDETLQLESVSSTTKQIHKDESTKLNAISPNISILRKVDRTAQQKLTLKEESSFKALTMTGKAQRLKDNSVRGSEIEMKRNDPAIRIVNQAPRNEQSSKVIIDHPRDTSANWQNIGLRRTIEDQIMGSQHESVSKDGKRICTVPHETKVNQPKLSHSSLKQIELDAEIPKDNAKKNKRCRPFRTKVGCVVAVRFRKMIDGGNPNVVWVAKYCDSSKPSGGCGDAKDKHEIDERNNNPSLEDAANSDGAQGRTRAGAGAKQGPKRKPRQHEFWSPPIPGKDDGIALLGSWIRCTLPQHTAEEKRNPGKKSSSHALEGNVISMPDNDRNESGIKVVMLVNHTEIVSHSCLQVLADNLDDATTSPSQRKMRELENQIRGRDKVAVQVTLAPVFDQRKSSKLDRGIIKQWSVRKRVGTKTEGKMPTNYERASHPPSSVQADHDTNCTALESNARESIAHLVGEVVKVDANSSTKSFHTLAMVTIKRLWTPEQTDGGRLAHHGPLELFDCRTDSGNEVYFQAPVEDLIVVGSGINRIVDAWKHPLLDSARNDGRGRKFTVTHSYHDVDNSFIPLCSGEIQTDSWKKCHGCQRSYHDSQLRTCQHHNSKNRPHWCTRCIEFKGLPLPSVDETTWDGPCCMEMCGCSLCPSVSNQSLYGKKIVQDKQRESTSGKIRRKHSKRPLSDTTPTSSKKLKATLAAKIAASETKKLFKAKCSRVVSFNKLPKRGWGLSKLKHASFFREKHHPRAIKIGKAEEASAPSGRAARASQRRIIKSLAALGDASKAIDRLAGRDREHLLRFDKSKIHGWGVYAEEQINAGDLIIEYRGEIIGNAVADKREKEYEEAKLDDYMFRIDAYTVCDATLLGNVARYINASCSPNCYTQIITAGENKRIVIFAKKDIQRGEELCYDYKFSLEYDPAKRIPCHCRSANCRGYMNWNKKYA